MAVEPLGPDLYAFLVDAFYDTPREERCFWVMSPAWWDECRKIDGYEPFMDGGPYMLGIPVVVRADAGVPALVADLASV